MDIILRSLKSFFNVPECFKVYKNINKTTANKIVKTIAMQVKMINISRK